MHFLGGFEKQYFQDGKKKLFFLLTKSRYLGEKKGVQFAWAKHPTMTGPCTTTQPQPTAKGPTHPTAGRAGHQAAHTTPRQQNRPHVTLVLTRQPHTHTQRAHSRPNQCGQQRSPRQADRVRYDDPERTQRAGYTPVASQRSPHPTCRPGQDVDHEDSPKRAARVFTRRTQLSPGRDSAGSGRKDPTTNKPAMRWLRQPCTNKTAAAATT